MTEIAKDGLSHFSLEYYKNTPLDRRKSLGQYFTPKNLRQEVLAQLPDLERPLIWEPSAGTGDFVEDLYVKYPEAEILASEIDKSLFDILCRRFSRRVTVYQSDTLLLDPPYKDHFDMVVGNPPYFEIVKPKKEYTDRYGDIISGRANAYALFVKVGLDALKMGGYLAYVIPPSMNSGSYFSKLRDYIAKTARIVSLKIYDSRHFDDAQQSVMVLILQKTEGGSEDFVFRRGNLNIFTPDPKELEAAYEGKETLESLGCSVKTGTVVWNQQKERLIPNDRHDAVVGKTLLIWGHNIGKDGEVILSDKKPQHFRAGDKFVPQTGPALVVNRTVGSVGNGSIRCAKIGPGVKFLAENHVNVITNENWDNDLEVWDHVRSQIRSAKTSSLVRKITGNTQISKTELANLIPITRM